MLDVWKMGFTGKGVVVAVVDEGIEKTHKELQNNFVSIEPFFLIHFRTWNSSIYLFCHNLKFNFAVNLVTSFSRQNR